LERSEQDTKERRREIWNAMIKWVTLEESLLPGHKQGLRL
jgi:hypothetical protein